MCISNKRQENCETDICSHEYFNLCELFGWTYDPVASRKHRDWTLRNGAEAELSINYQRTVHRRNWCTSSRKSTKCGKARRYIAVSSRWDTTPTHETFVSSRFWSRFIRHNTSYRATLIWSPFAAMCYSWLCSQSNFIIKVSEKTWCQTVWGSNARAVHQWSLDCDPEYSAYHRRVAYQCF